MGDNNCCTAGGFMLRDLTIQNYRCFKNFHIDGLARVNLIVGMNNSGKTSLLEAVYLLVNQKEPSRLVDLLERRGEIIDQAFPLSSVEPSNRSAFYQIRQIFHNRQLDLEQVIHLQAAEERSVPPLSLNIQLQHTSVEDTRQQDEVVSAISELKLVLSYIGYEQKTIQIIPVYGNGLIERRAIQSLKDNSFGIFLKTNLKSLFITTSNVNFEQLAVLWDKITLTPKENSIVEALKILDPAVERINFTSRQTFNSGILIKLGGQDEPVPLGSMGEGMHRILALVMSAVTVENGFLLIDEIEMGLHYEAQADMWRLLLQIAQRLNVQVFATTHSWDCISAFQEALDELQDRAVGKLFRLSRKGEHIHPVDYPAEKLSVAVRQSIEVR
ncbi:MAG TPA: AAA family ATPase [Waterburya sp.]|jgi:AAA15 family ATPase/GTPase